MDANFNGIYYEYTHIYINFVFLWELIEQFFKTDFTINVPDMYLGVEQRSH